MNEKHFILATAGHVDHGKSALVKALTGTDPDRLPEEKARQITIDLGFAELHLTGPDGEKLHVGIVDVPGHEDFVRNMIAGVGSIDLALLVVAADDGWMPQTEEHLQILTYLGVRRAVIAVTKSDLGKIDNVTAKIRDQLHGTALAESPIVPTSVRTGDGIENLKSALASEFAKLPAPRDIGKPRLFVDRVFSLHGIGTVVTGTLIGGKLRRGENVVVQPKNRPARIRSIQSHGRDLEFAAPGMRTAINLPDVAVGTDIQRGDVIAAQPFEASTTLDVLLTRSARLQRVAPIRSGASAYVHHGTIRALTKIIFAETDSLAGGASALAQLRLTAPLLAFVGDHFVVRDASEQRTIAGGVVLDVDSQRENCRSSTRSSLLSARVAAPHDVDLFVKTEIARAGATEPSRLLEKSRFSATEIAEALQRLYGRSEIFIDSNIAAGAQVWRELRGRAAEIIDTAHRSCPERIGMELSELRAQLREPPQMFDALIVDLCRDEFVRTGSTIARRSHRPSLSPELEAAAEKIRTALAKKPFDTPVPKEFTQDRHLQQALRFLNEQGEIIELGDDVVLLREAAGQMQKAVIEFISTRGAATASQLRQAIGTSRRVIIPFLEYLDRAGVTQRAGDLRQLREKKSPTVAHHENLLP